MIKKRVNAKENKIEVVFPPADKIEKLARKLDKFPLLDFRNMIEEATNEGSGTRLNDAFEEIVVRRTNKQIAEVFEALGLDQKDPERFVKGFVLLSMVFLGVGVVGFTPAPRKIARWTERHDDLLLVLMNYYVGNKHKESQALRLIASESFF